jgi:electron transfer flavoprotein beta subunit
VTKPEDLGVDVTPRLKTVKVAEPAKRSAGIKVPDVATLVAKLRTEAKVHLKESEHGRISYR